jgi:hypothetical protein
MRSAFRSPVRLQPSVTAPVLLAMALAMTLGTGCQSRNTADGFPTLRTLQAEVGTLNLDTAVQRFGPPANRIELKDHSVITEWEVATEAPPSFTFGLGSPSGSAEPVTGPTVGGGIYHRYRQLQFDAGHRLVLVQDIKR